MNEIVNGELSITLPEGFKRMPMDELKRIYTADIETMCGFRDEDRHVIVVIVWNESNKVLAKIASEKDIAKRVEKAQSRALKKAGYRKSGFFESRIAGEKACGFKFGYTVQGTDQDAEANVFIHGACCYTLFFYGRSANAQADAILRDEMLASLAFQ